MIPNKSAYMDIMLGWKGGWLSPGIIKIKVSNVACVLPILLSICLTLLCKCFEALSEINVRVEAIICEKLPPLMEITYHL